jgi:hypothetical protein
MIDFNDLTASVPTGNSPNVPIDMIHEPALVLTGGGEYVAVPSGASSVWSVRPGSATEPYLQREDMEGIVSAPVADTLNRGKREWKTLGFHVPANVKPTIRLEHGNSPKWHGYRARNLYSPEQVVANKATTGAASPALRGRTGWKTLGFRVPTTAKPQGSEEYLVPGYKQVYRTRYLYGPGQVVAINEEQAAKRSLSAERAVETRVDNMIEAMKTAELTIGRGRTPRQIYELARATHGGNYQGQPREFNWHNGTARNCIRHNLTDYESLWRRINRGGTGSAAYGILRARIDKLVDEAYPEYRESAPEVHIDWTEAPSPE